MLEGMSVVDLSAILHAGTVMWPGAPAPVAETLLTVADNGFYARRVSVFEHTGTHFDAPCHFIEGSADVASVPASQLVVPLRVLDIAADIGSDADGVLTLAQVHVHEAEHGAIPPGAAVFVRTGWEDKHTDARAYAGPEGDLHFPGIGVAAAQYLVTEREVIGLGTDTLGIDPGCASDFPVHSQVSHPRGVWHVENLINLAQVPAVGAWVVVGVPKLAAGSGFPARVLALVP